VGLGRRRVCCRWGRRRPPGRQPCRGWRCEIFCLWLFVWVGAIGCISGLYNAVSGLALRRSWGFDFLFPQRVRMYHYGRGNKTGEGYMASVGRSAGL
jgi:hypothetical protein